MNYIKHSLKAFVALLLCHAMLMAGTTGKISGRVIDAASGEPLPGANVVIQGTSLGAATDADGDYFIINILPGTYSVEATMIGYQGVNMTSVLVSTDNTTPVNYELGSTALEMESVTVTAEREVISMDQSASVITATAEEIADLPLMTDISDFISLQAGIEGDIVRGGSIDQTSFMMDGLLIVDNRANQPMVMVNLSAIKEISIIKGGFNAEYGNVRSGLINVVTKEGSMERYHGSADIRMSPAHLKHSGTSLFSWDNFYMRPFLDPDVMWDGTSATGAANTDGKEWTPEMQHQYPTFDGWKKVAEDSDSPDDTPQDWLNLFQWLHRTEASPDPNAKGAKALGQKPGSYGDQPDWNVDLSLGGPIPVLPNVSFFTSFRRNSEQFALPINRENYVEQNLLFKLTSQLTSNMRLSVEALNGTINTTSSRPRGGSGYTNQYMDGGTDVFNYPIGEMDAWGSSGGMAQYFPSTLVPFDIYRNMQGLSFDHMLSPKTFYNLRVTHITLKNEAYTYDRDRETDPKITFIDGEVKENFTTPDGYPVLLTEFKDSPYGFYYALGNQITQANMTYGGVGGAARDSSEVSTINVKFDITSQVNKYHQLKAGFLFNYDDINTRQASRSLYLPSDDSVDRWSHQPIRLGAYVQDKLEFEGMIANFGLRLDYNEPNTDWFTVSPYSKYLSRKYMGIFQDIDSLQTKAEGHLKISPRLGVSHPITETAKMYFNYGHFYSMPTSTDMYGIGYGSQAEGVDFLGNPSANLPKTVAYELGIEASLFGAYLVHLSGYYKDVSAQTGDVAYTNYDGSVDYETIENNNYEDIRGFEFTLQRRFGRYFRGWLNYNYVVRTRGFVGREHYYQDERLNRIWGLQNPYQEVPLPRPFARASVTFTTPDIGPVVAGQSLLGNIDIGLLYRWKSGSYRTWDPLETYQLQDNLHYKSQWYLDARIDKRLYLGGFSFTLFADVNNLLGNEYLALGNAFEDDVDVEEYYKSLKLPMYEGKNAEERQEYENAGYFAGDDRPGDTSDDQSYINMPNREYLWYLNPRSVFVGIKFEF